MATNNFSEENITLDGKFPLKGTLTIPADKHNEQIPAVLLIAGSGKIDRDGNITNPKVNIELYKKLAELITSLGFITLRYDKRGVGESGGNYLEAGMWDFVDDVVISTMFLQNHPQVDPEKIILLGHGEGCTLATAANARCPVNGLILLSGAAESMEEAAKHQRILINQELQKIKGIKGSLLRLFRIEQLIENRANALNKRVINSNKSIINTGFKIINAKWLREHLKYSLSEDLKKVTCPVLAATGTKDFQANPEKLELLSQLIQGDAETYIIENMDHGLKEELRNISIMDFKILSKHNIPKPIHPELQNILIRWLKKY